MIKIQNTQVTGFEAAVRGARNPMNSWSKSDSRWIHSGIDETPVYQIGEADRKLLLKLALAGDDHGKFLRMITVTCDITAPMFWNAELDTYKVGTVRNSCSKMHKLASKPITLKDFSLDETADDEEEMRAFCYLVGSCERLRQKYNNTGDVRYWRMLIERLPESYNQRYTWQANYAVLRNMYHARKHHKLTEWHDFCEWCENLPNSWLITEVKRDD